MMARFDSAISMQSVGWNKIVSSFNKHHCLVELINKLSNILCINLLVPPEKEGGPRTRLLGRMSSSGWEVWEMTKAEGIGNKSLSSSAETLPKDKYLSCHEQMC